jgi:hypothetical protein
MTPNKVKITNLGQKITSNLMVLEPMAGRLEDIFINRGKT